jgi:AraC-like DNA-binding protein/quercetin dioxygenase-like cupin family protein
MDIEQVVAELSAPWDPDLIKTYPRYKDSIPGVNLDPYTFYPDGSRSFDDLVMMVGKITADASPVHLILGAFLLKHQFGELRACFDDGFLSPVHKHNFVELDYVVEGQFHKKIEGRDYVFNKGDIFLIGRDIGHSEYLYQKNSVVLCLGIANTLFDKSMHLDVASRKAEEFIRRFVINGKRSYCFARFTDPLERSLVPGLFEQILSELWRPLPGSTRLIIGYVERILNLLPAEYEITVQWNDRPAAQKRRFEEIRQYLDSHYADISISDLIKHFGHNVNYFNRLIKNHTGMTYSGFVQNVRLEKARYLLRTTGFPVEEIAMRVGYGNLTWFYKIFYAKFGVRPSDLRKPPAAKTVN